MKPTGADTSHEAEYFLALLWRHIYQRVRDMLHPHHFEHEPGGKDAVSLPLGFLRDVTLDGPINAEVLGYDTDHWTNMSVAEVIAAHTHALDDLSDVEIDDPDAGELLTFDGSIWINSTPAEVALSLRLGGLKDVLLTTPSDGDTLVYDADGEKGEETGIWVNGAGGTGGGTPHAVHFSVQLPATVLPPGPKNLTGSTRTITAAEVATDSSGVVSGSLAVIGAFATGSAIGGLPKSWGAGVTLTWGGGGITDTGDGTWLTIDLAVT